MTQDAATQAGPPTRPSLDPDDPRTSLREGVISALMSLPGEFEFDHLISGINATDLFNLNTLLGAGIETEVVRTLNSLRHIWDPENNWRTYHFERSAQAFPDVRLVSRQAEGEIIALGIELKGWWLLAKEGVPSMRYQVAPAACAAHDLIRVVPWRLSAAVSGRPVAEQPWIESAKFAAEWRDHWWSTIREAKGTAVAVSYPRDAAPYPTKADRVAAMPSYDGGGNYGRLPRCKPLMDAFISQSMAIEILGIQAKSWVAFLNLHKETASPESIVRAMNRDIEKRDQATSANQAEEMLKLLEDIAAKFMA